MDAHEVEEEVGLPRIHIAVDVETKQIVAMEVTDERTGDGRMLESLVEQAGVRCRVVKLLGDGAYESGDVFMMLETRGIEAVIRPRRNSRPDTPSPARRRAVRQYRCLGYDAWARLKGYGRRWMVKTAFSTFKRMFGEHSLARTLENIARELVAKVAIFLMLVNL